MNSDKRTLFSLLQAVAGEIRTASSCGDQMKEVAEYMDRQSRQWLVAFGYVLLVLLGLVDHLSGELMVEPFYLVPLFVVTWFGSRRAAFAAAVCASGIWYASNGFSGHFPEMLGARLWNLTWQTGLFLVFVGLSASVKSARHYRKEMSRTDALTGMMSGVFFEEQALVEIKRSQRYDRPFTVAFVEFDLSGGGPAAVPSSFLCCAAQPLRAALRGTDLAARLDEVTLAVLCPETGPEPGRVVVQKLQEQIGALVREEEAVVPFGIGAVTFRTPPTTVGEMFRRVGSLAHSASRHPHASFVRHEVIGGTSGKN